MEIQQSIQEKIDIEEDKQVLDYYEYLRSINQITQLSYWIGNPSVQIISGKLLLESFLPIRTKKEPENFQLYLKEILKANKYETHPQIQTPQIQSESKPSDTDEMQSPSKIQKEPSKKIKSRCLVICGIPNSKSPVQVMETECISRNSQMIKQIRVIKTVHIKYYGMLLLMKDEQCAGDFFNELYGCEYNGLQMEKIIIREIKSISLAFTELSIEGGNNEMNLFRSINENSQYIAPQNIFMTYHHQKLKPKIQQSTQLQKPNFSELVCVICFEECNKQAISILCGHYFDLACLEKWSETICPLCRYHQQPPIIKFCEKCNQCQGLWVCLICGSRLCCGVNNDILSEDSHIYDHFKTTAHSLSMELETKFLFDAKIPAFLHQKFYKDLIQNQSEEKLRMEEKNAEECHKKDKITQQIQQYELQVSQQMKRQRLYFEDQINQNLKQHRNILSKKRVIVQEVRSRMQNMDVQQKQTLKQIEGIEKNSQKKTKQLEILRNLIKMKQQKVQEKRQQISEIKHLKATKLKQFDQQIKQRKEQILNYRKNLQIRQKFSQKLKGEEVEGEFVLSVPDQKNNKKKKKGHQK